MEVENVERKIQKTIPNLWVNRDRMNEKGYQLVAHFM